MLPDALLFDFDGVVVDTEPIHYEGFARVLADMGLQLDRELYYDRYLGYDDHDGFVAILRDLGEPFGDDRLAELIDAKAAHVERLLSAGVRPIPGAVELLRSVAGQLPVAICSGALRQEIEQASAAIGVGDCFEVIVAAGDTPAGKPDPSGYLRARDLLAERAGRDLSPARCVVIEDSPGGIAAGKAAGMFVVAYTTSHPAELLASADRIVADASQVSLPLLEQWLADR